MRCSGAKSTPASSRGASSWNSELIGLTAPDGDVAKFIEKRGEGIMLLSFNVDDTREAMAELEQAGYPFIGGARPFRDCEFAFIHPKKVNGVLLELIDYSLPEGDYRFVNAEGAEAGEIRYAGFTVEAFESPVALVLRFRTKRALDVEDMSAELEVVGDVLGREVKRERILEPRLEIAR